MRIDKYLADCGIGSRSEIKKILKSGAVSVNGTPIRQSSHAVDETKDAVTYQGKTVSYRKFVYLMLHKPAGVVSATEDNLHPTVLSLLGEEYKHFDLFPCGRLDIDTEGLLLITNDGQTAHKLLSPKHKAPKVYYAEVDGKLTDETVTAFREGVDIGGYVTMPAELRILETGETSKAEVTVFEGKFHQVKKMFLSCGATVTYLKRLSFGGLTLDPCLPCGSFRELTAEEIAILPTELCNTNK